MQLLRITFLLLLIALNKAQLVVNCDNLEASVKTDLTTLINSFSDEEKANVTTLICNNAGFSGGIPESIVEFPNLEVLSLANNEFEGGLPTNLGLLTNLTSVNVNNNCLTGSLLNLFIGIEIEELRVNRNKFEGNLEELPESLTVFSATFNDFSGSLPDTIANINNLTEFEVNGNRLSGSIPNVFENLPLTRLFLTNNDIEGTVPNHTATETDAAVGSSVNQANLDQRWRKYTLDSKCPNRFSFAIDKMFSESLEFTLPILGGGVLLFFGLVFCLFWCCLRRLGGKSDKKSTVSTQYTREHYKIDVYMCESATPSIEAKKLTKKLKSKLKEKKVRTHFQKTLNENVMADAAAVCVLFTQDYFDEMSEEGTRAFMEVFSAKEAGQWILFVCLEKKLFTLGKTTDFLDADYHLHDLSSMEAIEENFVDLMDNLYQAQAEKEMLLKQHT